MQMLQAGEDWRQFILFSLLFLNIFCVFLQFYVFLHSSLYVFLVVHFYISSHVSVETLQAGEEWRHQLERHPRHIWLLSLHIADNCRDEHRHYHDYHYMWLATLHHYREPEGESVRVRERDS